jgi:hypothetical protein
MIEQQNSSKGASAKFHWTAENIPDACWMDHVRNIATQNGWETIVYEDKPRLTVILDKVHLDFHVTNGKARDNIPDDSGCWKAVLFLLKLSKQYTVLVVDDEAIPVTIRSLKKLTNIGFNDVEFDNLAENLGLINKSLAKDPAFSNFF